jgi:hypothetical protein
MRISQGNVVAKQAVNFRLGVGCGFVCFIVK